MNTEITIKELPEDSSPYEKFAKYGPDSLTDEELLAIIIRTGTKGENSKTLAARLLNCHDGHKGLTGLQHYTYDQLLSVKGIGKVKAIQIRCICELSKRISSQKYKNALDFNNPKTIADYYMEHFRHLECEQTLVVYLDSKCKMLGDKVMFTGTVNQSFLSPREIFIEALRHNAVFIAVLHNHPSGDCTPSMEDRVSTKRLVEAGKVIGITLIDHLIIGDKSFTSLRQAGIIK